MSMWDLTIGFIYLVLIMIMAMILVSSFRKALMTISLKRLCSKVNGRVSQKGFRSFPRFDGEYGSRRVAVFFHIAKTKKAHPAYLLCTVAVDLPFKLFILRKDEFKYLEGFNVASEVGPPLEGLKDGFKAWSDDGKAAGLILDDSGLKEDMDSLGEFPSFLFGPDHIVIGKQYEGRKDLSINKVVQELSVMERMAKRAEALCRR